MTRTIAIRPETEGWSLRIDDNPGVLVFRSGAEAESVARRLATRLARFGEAAKILIYLRDGSLGGRLVAAPGQVVATA